MAPVAARTRPDVFRQARGVSQPIPFLSILNFSSRRPFPFFISGVEPLAGTNAQATSPVRPRHYLKCGSPLTAKKP